jgi:hypothetical protein
MRYSPSKYIRMQDQLIQVPSIEHPVTNFIEIFPVLFDEVSLLGLRSFSLISTTYFSSQRKCWTYGVEASM